MKLNLFLCDRGTQNHLRFPDSWYGLGDSQTYPSSFVNITTIRHCWNITENKILAQEITRQNNKQVIAILVCSHISEGIWKR